MIVEEDMTIASVLKNHFLKWGFDAFYVKDFNNIIEQFESVNPQLLLLDISLPFYNGYHWCSEIRKFSKVPIIFIFSDATNISIAMAMNIGGDGYITKPIDLTVVIAKVQALLRRTYSFQYKINIIEHKGAVLMLGDASMSYMGKKIELAKNELKILQLLLEHKGTIISREVIMKSLWDRDSFIDDNTLTVNVTRLRGKLEELGLSDFIITKKELGYMVVE